MSWDFYALAVMGVLTMVWLLVPLAVCFREAFRRRGSGSQLGRRFLRARGKQTGGSPPKAFCTGS